MNRRKIAAPLVACALMLIGCQVGGGSKTQGATKGEERQPTPPQVDEFSASLYSSGKLYPVKISRKKDRFLLRRDNLIYCGALSAKGDIYVLDPKTKTALKVERGKSSRLYDSHGKTPARRYEKAVETSRAYERRQDILDSMRFPCEIAEEALKWHPSCEVLATRDPDVAQWTHSKSSFGITYRGFERPTESLVMEYNEKFGVITSSKRSIGTRTDIDSSMRSLKEESFKAEDFRVPLGYTELLNDKDLRDPLFQDLGKSEMVKGLDLENFTEYVIEYPGAPAPSLKVFQSEKWWPRGHSSPNSWIHLQRLYFKKPFDATKTPFNEDYKFQIKSWDKKSEYGEYSYRKSANTVIFFADNQLFQVSTSDRFRDKEAEICNYLLKTHTKVR